jgi:hypothetical protein
MLICWMNCWKRMCLEMMPSWCGQVNWGNCGINWVNCAVFCVKDDWKGQVKTAQFTQFFPSVMTLHSKIAQFNWQCIWRFTTISFVARRKIKWRPADTYTAITNEIRNFEWWQTIGSPGWLWVTNMVTVPHKPVAKLSDLEIKIYPVQIGLSHSTNSRSVTHEIYPLLWAPNVHVLQNSSAQISKPTHIKAVHNFTHVSIYVQVFQIVSSIGIKYMMDIQPTTSFIGKSHSSRESV